MVLLMKRIKLKYFQESNKLDYILSLILKRLSNLNHKQRAKFVYVPYTCCTCAMEFAFFFFFFMGFRIMWPICLFVFSGNSHHEPHFLLGDCMA